MRAAAARAAAARAAAARAEAAAEAAAAEAAAAADAAAPLASGSREWEGLEALRTQGMPSGRGIPRGGEAAAEAAAAEQPRLHVLAHAPCIHGGIVLVARNKRLDSLGTRHQLLHPNHVWGLA